LRRKLEIMTRHDSTLAPSFRRHRARISPTVWHAIGLVVALLLAYLAWRGYQSPDLMLDLSSGWRMC